MFLSFCVKDTPGTKIFSSEKISSSSMFVKIFLTNNLSNALEVSARIIQFLRNVNPWINTSFLARKYVFQFCFSRSSQMSILNANYIAKKLSEKYKILYTGKSGNVAHECIIDIRPIKEKKELFIM